MHLTENQLRKLIKDLLLEQDDWLDDDDEVLYTPRKKAKTVEDYRSLLNKAILKEKQDLARKSQLSNKLIDDVLKVLDNIAIGIDNVDPSSKAYVRHVGFNPDGSIFRESLENVKVGSEVKNAYRSAPQMNPIIVIVPSVFDKLSDKEKTNTLEHEVNHIRNNFLKMKVGLDLNVEEVRAVLRQDFRGKGIGDIVNTLSKEGRFKSGQKTLAQVSTKRLISKLKEYYDGAFSDPPDELSIDEFAVRFGKLQDYPSVVKNHKGKLYSELLKKYGSEVAQAVLFIDPNTTVKKVNRIVKSNQPENKINIKT